MINIAVIDKEKSQAMSWKVRINHFFERNEMACTVDVFEQNMENAPKEKVYDAILLELSSSDPQGTNMAFSIRERYKNALMILICDTEKYAIQGYELEIMDYLLKPISILAWKRVLEKLKYIFKEREENIVVKTAMGIVILSADEIYYVEVYDHDLIYHTKRGDFHVRGQFWKVQQQLAAHDFLNCSRSCIVNLKHIASVSSQGVEVRGEILNLSRPRKKSFCSEYESYQKNGYL